MEWRGEGILLSARKHGETAAIIEVFAPGQGRYAGVVRGGVSRKMTPILQPGAQLSVTWRARLEEHIGAFTVEPLKGRAGQIFGDRLALAGMTSALALLSFALPEREAHDLLYERTVGLLDMIGVNPVWPLAYLRWELALLDELGFGLDLTTCAVTGTGDDLAFVSPKSGRAVSREGAGEGAPGDIATGLRTTGHFLEQRVAEALGHRSIPEARRRFADLLARQG